MLNQKAAELIDKSQNHIHLFVSEKSQKRLQLIIEALKTAKKRGVKVSIITTGKLEVANGFVIGKTEKAPCEFLCIDSKEALLIERIPDDETIHYGRDLGVWIQNKSFVRCLEHLFENHNVNNSNKLNVGK